MVGGFMKKILIGILVSILVLGSVAAYISQSYPHEAKAGQSNTFIVTLFNHGNSRVKDARVTGYIPYLDVRGRSDTFKLRSNEADRTYLEMDIPDTNPDFYPLILTLTNSDGVRERKHSWIYIS